jgi:hypothetical protein
MHGPCFLGLDLSTTPESPEIRLYARLSCACRRLTAPQFGFRWEGLVLLAPEKYFRQTLASNQAQPVPPRGLSLSALGLRRDSRGSVKQIHHEELEDSDKEWPSAFPKIVLKQTDSGVQQLHDASERTQDQ